jgi:hypothetical protein
MYLFMRRCLCRLSVELPFVVELLWSWSVHLSRYFRCTTWWWEGYVVHPRVFWYKCPRLLYMRSCRLNVLVFYLLHLCWEFQRFSPFHRMDHILTLFWSCSFNHSWHLAYTVHLLGLTIFSCVATAPCCVVSYVNS